MRINIVDTKGNVGNTQVLHSIEKNPMFYVGDTGVYTGKTICPICGEEISKLIQVFNKNKETGWKNDGIVCPNCWNVLFYDTGDAQYFLDTNKIPEHAKPYLISKALE